MDVVLDTTDAAPGSVFRVGGGRTPFVCDIHNGGTWTLQMRPPGGNWIDVDGADFDGVDQWDIRTPATCEYRWAGGTTGARIWAEGVIS